MQQLTANVNLTSHTVANITLTNGGFGYTSAPTVTIVGTGAGATATASIATSSVSSINIISPGTGWTSAPRVSITGGNGTGATAVASINSEVHMVPATPNSGLPDTWPTDGRDGGVPDPGSVGPDWIQIGTEGGFLPAPAVVPSVPVGYDYNRRSIVVLNVLNKALYLGPAERADVVVDFSGIPNGAKIILYNDAPAPMPGFDPRLDYYTGNPDFTDTGGAPTTLPGYGPNTRTIMRFDVNSAISPAGSYNIAGLSTALPAAFQASQDPPIIPESAYGAYPDTYVPIQNNSVVFTPVGNVTSVNMSLQPKAIQELFDMEYGRMNSQLGVEIPLTSIITQTTIPYYYVDPPSEVFNNSISGTQIGSLGDGTQIWKITHNGVDTHAIHWHMFNVQVINRVGWDGAIRPPDDNELGWKDTVRMNPLEDCIVAMRPITPNIPWDLPNSIRPLDPSNPLNATLTPTQFTNVDVAGQPVTVINHMVNFGWEYVWHCHLLGHEEFDMMRPMAVAKAPVAPSSLTIVKTRKCC